MSVITQAKRAEINQQLQQVDSILQETINQQYAISSEEDASLFFQENIPKVCKARQQLKNILMDIAQ